MERYLVELTGDQLDRLNGWCEKQSTLRGERLDRR